MPDDDKPKPKVNQPKFIPTAAQRSQVQILRGCGWPVDAIARFFSISKPTLYSAFRDELAHGKDALGCRLTLGLAQQAMQGKLAAIFFMLKTQYGWRENVGVQALGKDGQPVSFDRLDTPALEQILAALTTGGTGRLGATDIGAEEAGDNWPTTSMVPQYRTPN